MEGKKMRKWKAFLACFLIVILLSPSVIVNAEASNYTYTYDFWGLYQSSPDAYTPIENISGSALGVGDFKDPQGLFIRENRIYVCDSGNNRVVILRFENETYEVIKEISSVTINGEESTLNNPTDVFESEDGEVYISDCNNQRILHLNPDGSYQKQITKPTDGTILEQSDFLPIKLVVDKAKRIYVQAKNVNKGLMEFDHVGDFTGYVGANKVQVNLKDYLWKMISTKAQRAQMELFVPTEYNNVCLDEDGFLYATTSTFDQGNIENANPIRRLNSMGTDILVRNGWYNPNGDVDFADAGGISGCSRFVDVATMAFDSYCCLDRVRGRIFMYDFQGNLLYAFGGLGNKLGSFLYPVAIASMGERLFVLDSRAGSFTRFDLTAYGNLINAGIKEYKLGEYEASSNSWREVLKLNGNYDLAYIGIGRALLRQGEYKEAMQYFKVKKDFENYSKAFQLYRKQWIEENIVTILLIVAVIIIAPKTVRFVKKVKKEVFEE